MKRKQEVSQSAGCVSRKKRRVQAKDTPALTNTSHPVLERYYNRVCPLREFILDRVPNISKRRAHVLSRNNAACRDAEKESFGDAHLLLDKVLVGVDDAALAGFSFKNRLEDFQQFTQQLTASTAGSLFGQATLSYAEIVDFALWTLFFRVYPTVQKPPHVLCHGHSRASTTHYHDSAVHGYCPVPGLVTVFPNEHLATIRSKQWSQLHELIGRHGDHIMVDLLVHCSLFLPLEGADRNLYQLSGVPLSDMIPLKPRQPLTNFTTTKGSNAVHRKSKSSDTIRKPSEIRLVRHRMLYTRAALNAKGDVAFGLRHIHVFRRYSNVDKPEHTLQIMKYIFPRQFSLHNVFTSKTDARETAQPFKDYTLREEEIAKADAVLLHKSFLSRQTPAPQRLPKRLRNGCLALIRKLQIRHKRCSYTQLLHHYCPPSAYVADIGGEAIDPVITSLAVPTAQVSAFCRAVICHVFPLALFGGGDTAEHNRKTLCERIDTFIAANRFETMTLESIMLGMKIEGIPWLCPQGVDRTAKMSLSDFTKRKELFAELIYYIFDSFLIPLIRSNFHVIESSTDKNRLFYFRHDIWKQITEPAITQLKATMLEEMGNANAQRILNKRDLGFSQIRLLPKDRTLRTISNLKRRAQVMKDGHTWLGKSINSVLAPAFSVLKYEKQLHPENLGASLFSVTDIFSKLQAFRTELFSQGLSKKNLYFVKVDVKSCFDSLPQAELIALAQRLPSSTVYSISNHAEVSLPDFDNTMQKANKPPTAPKRRFHRIAVAGTPPTFSDAAQSYSIAKRRPNTVFVSSVIPQHIKREQINSLQSQHIGAHIVRIGKKYYRQKQGIPQGSVLSSLLCNFFYADFEAKHLGFISTSKDQASCGKGNSVLLRLIDDFLLITTERDTAEEFVKLMHKGNREYGITIKPEKSLVNFDIAVNDHFHVPKLNNGASFPYCGVQIDTRTLAISKDGSKQKVKNIKDSLTIEYSQLPGHTFRRKMLSGLKIQMHTMLLDTSYNSPITVIRNICAMLRDVASRCFAYAKYLAVRNKVAPHKKKEKDKSTTSASSAHGNQGLLNMRLINDIAALASTLTHSPRHKLRHPSYRCSISKAAITWLTLHTFHALLETKPTLYTLLLSALQREIRKVRLASVEEREMLISAVDISDAGKVAI